MPAPVRQLVWQQTDRAAPCLTAARQVQPGLLVNVLAGGFQSSCRRVRVAGSMALVLDLPHLVTPRKRGGFLYAASSTVRPVRYACS